MLRAVLFVPPLIMATPAPVAEPSCALECEGTELTDQACGDMPDVTVADGGCGNHCEAQRKYGRRLSRRRPPHSSSDESKEEKDESKEEKESPSHESHSHSHSDSSDLTAVLCDSNEGVELTGGFCAVVGSKWGGGPDAEMDANTIGDQTDFTVAGPGSWCYTGSDLVDGVLEDPDVMAGKCQGLCIAVDGCKGWFSHYDDPDQCYHCHLVEEFSLETEEKDDHMRSCCVPTIATDFENECQAICEGAENIQLSACPTEDVALFSEFYSLKEPVGSSTNTVLTVICTVSIMCLAVACARLAYIQVKSRKAQEEVRLGDAVSLQEGGSPNYVI